MNGPIETTPRERAVLRGLAAGYTLTQVASQLHRLGYTAGLDQMKRIAGGVYRKLGVSTQAGAVHEAILRGILPCPCPTHDPSHPSRPSNHPTLEGTHHA